MRILLAALACALVIAPGLSAQCTVGLPIVPGLEDFDAATTGSPGVYPTDWVDGGGTFPWSVNSGGTSSFNTGPSGDNTSGTGNYIYFETSSPAVAGNTAIIETPCYDISGLTNPAVNFYRHMFGATIDTLALEQDDGVGGWTPLWSLTGNQGDEWRRVQVGIAAGTTARFRFVATRGSSFTGDSAVDDFSVGEFDFGVWETNSAEASLDWDGVQGDAFDNPIVDVSTTQMTTLNIASSLMGQSYDIYTVLSAGVPSFLTTVNNQKLNVNIFDPTFGGLNGGAGVINGLAPFVAGFPIPLVIPVPLTATAQMIITNPAHPDGFELSQPAQIQSFQDPALGAANTSGTGTALTLTDDSSIVMALGFTFNFYGVGYTEVYVGSNGHCTFNNGNSGWASGGSALNGGDPTIAPCAEDFNPAAGGMVEFNASPALNTFEVWWRNVPSFGTTNSNTFKLVATDGALTQFNYDAMMAETEGTVGLSAGGGVNALLPVNLSRAGGLNGPIVVPPASTPFEDFTAGGNPLDLPGFQVNFIMDAMGNPVGIQ